MLINRRFWKTCTLISLNLSAFHCLRFLSFLYLLYCLSLAKENFRDRYSRRSCTDCVRRPTLYECSLSKSKTPTVALLFETTRLLPSVSNSLRIACCRLIFVSLFSLPVTISEPRSSISLVSGTLLIAYSLYWSTLFS